MLEADLDFDMAGSEEGPVQRAGPLFAKLGEIMQTSMGLFARAEGLESALESLDTLADSAGKLHLDDSSRLFNTNLLDALRLKAGIRIGKGIGSKCYLEPKVAKFKEQISLNRMMNNYTTL